MAWEIQQVGSCSTSTSPTSILQCQFDVFLSFRGEDTRKNFTDHLYTALIQKEIRTFRDEEELEKGEVITPQLLKAIEGSRIFIVIFSKTYVYSSWCLNELVEIIECRRKTGRVVCPVFYHVDPSHVRKQTGNYGEAFANHEKNADNDGMQKIKRWRAALSEAGNLVGWHVHDQYESRIVKEISEHIVGKMLHKPCIKDNLVGIESRLKELIKLINVELQVVLMVGIYGPCGIGKTTIAQAIFNEISSQFEGVSFLAHVRKVSKEYLGLIRLQEQLFRDILVPRGNREISFHRGNNRMKDKIRRKKVLVIVDDVDDLKQLQFLVEKHDCFGKGSRIIITAVDKDLLINHGVNELYEPPKLDDFEALNLFTQNAIVKEQSRCNFLSPSNHAVDYCHGLPLALKVLASSLRRKTLSQWKRELEDLKSYPRASNMEILNVLRISYDGLIGTEKDILLDIACFFNGEYTNFVTKILDGCGFFPKDGIKVLSDRCLLTISDQKLWMHNSIQELGWEMVRQKNKKKGERSRLWDHDDVQYVLKHNKGTDAIEGIFIDLSELNQLQFTTEAFAKMTELRVLKVFLGWKNVCEENCKVLFSGDLELSASDLIYLHWHGYPSDSFPSNFQADLLLELHMPFSCLKHLKEDEGCFPRLTVLDLSHSRNLVKISNFSIMPMLQILILEGCTSLLEIDSSIEELHKLIFLNLNGCKNLDSLPSSFCKLKSLETLIVSGCFRPQKISVDLTANRTAASRSISQLPLFGLCSLRELDLSECLLSDGAIPSNFWCLSSLERLNLSGNDFAIIPEGITQLSKLRVLQLGYCQRLLGIPNLPPTVQEVDAHGCSSLKSLLSSPTSNFIDETTILWRIQNLAPNNEFCILLPGSGIPDWFGDRKIGCSVTTEKLPPEWRQVNLLGFAVCFVSASEHEIPEHTPVVSCKINDFRFSYTFSCGRGENGFVESDHLWLAYKPRAQVENFHPNDWTQIKASFEIFGIGPHDRVKECAINLIYADR